jgi:mycofactocin glycosyltransferase
MTHMIADQLKELWDQVDRKTITWQQFEQQKTQWLDGYAAQWLKALLFKGSADLLASSHNELQRHLGLKNADELKAWRDRANAALPDQWKSIDPADPRSVQQFYNGCELELYNLLTWHTLVEDDSPLAYVAALEFAKPYELKTYLDFGSGVGSGGILFARNEYRVSLGDVSSPLLRFCKWRFDQRALPVECIDLKTQSLPANRFDFITAMDVFEHLVDPVATAEQVCNALTGGGILFGRFHIDPNDTHITHIARDFGPMFARMNQMGMKQIWQDQWLWGHQAFQKVAGHERAISDL